jgi:hypothetical protein
MRRTRAPNSGETESLPPRCISERLTSHAEAKVFLILGMIGIALGAISALAATKLPGHQARLERWSGDLIVTGVALLGFSFPMI